MKKTLLSLSTLALFMIGCGGNQESSTTSSSTSAPTVTSNSTPYTTGKALIAKSDCIGCHRPDKKIIGPSYEEIAEKYEATEQNINEISDRILSGSKGIWGSIPMTPHPKITKDEAVEIVKYIMTFKKP